MVIIGTVLGEGLVSLQVATSLLRVLILYDYVSWTFPLTTGVVPKILS